MRKFAMQESGTAAVEFTLITPLLIMLWFGIIETVERFSISWDTQTYNYQVGDYLARSADLSSSDFSDVYAIRDEVMQTVDTATSQVSLRFISVGYDEDGDALILWDEAIGPETLPFDIEDAAGLATHGQSVLFTVTKVSTTTLFHRFGGPSAVSTQQAFFRPRITRAIALDGSLTENNRHEDGYNDTETESEGEPETNANDANGDDDDD